MRICFHLRVRPDKLAEYKALHRAVWPEMLGALKAAGVRNYSIFLWNDAPEQGHEFGILECDDWDAVRRHLASNPVVARWEAFMADYLLTPVGSTGPTLLEEVFHLA